MDVRGLHAAVRVLAAVAMGCLLVRCADREGKVGLRDNPFDAGGTHWTHDVAPLIDSVLVDSVPLWSDFCFADSTGSVELLVRARDPNGSYDQLRYRMLVGTAPDSLLDTTEGDTVLVAGGLLRDTQYRYRVEVRDSWDSVAFQSGWLRTSADLPPPAPDDVATTGGASSVVISWTDSSADSVRFLVYRSEEPSARGELLADTLVGPAAGVVRYTDWTLMDRALHYYRVAACNEHGQSVSGAFAGWRPHTVSGYAYAQAAYADSSTVSVDWWCLPGAAMQFVVLRSDSATREQFVAAIERRCDSCLVTLSDTVPLYGRYCYSIVGIDSVGRAGRPLTACADSLP